MIDLVDCRDSQASTRWQIVNDGVMGGRSQSRVEVADGHAIFTGSVSLENNGGFASVRMQLATAADALGNIETIRLRVRGDSKRYQVRIRTDERWDSPAYKHDFATEAETWQDIALPLSGFQSTYRGRPVKNAPALKGDRIRQIGVLIADKQAGPFRLEIARIAAK